MGRWAWRTFGAVLFLCAGLTHFAAPSRAEDRIRIANGEWPPYLSENLPGHGYASQIVEEALKAAGMEVEWAFLPWQRAYGQAKRGDYDATVIWRRTPRRERDFLYSVPVIQCTDVVFMLKDQMFDWRQGDETDQRVVGTNMFTPIELFIGQVKGAQPDVVTFPEFNLMLPALVNRRVDAIVMDAKVGRFLASRQFPPEVADRIVIHPEAVVTLDYHVMVSRRHADARALLARIDAAIRAFQNGPRFAELTRDFQSGAYSAPAHGKR